MIIPTLIFSCPQEAINLYELKTATFGIIAVRRLQHIENSIRLLLLYREIHREQYHFYKRAIISAIAKLFDPLGWLAQVIIVATILMQNIWLEGTECHKPASHSTMERWHIFRNRYMDINNIHISIRISFSPSDAAELHSFCNA